MKRIKLAKRTVLSGLILLCILAAALLDSGMVFAQEGEPEVTPTPTYTPTLTPTATAEQVSAQ